MPNNSPNSNKNILGAKNILKNKLGLQIII